MKEFIIKITYAYKNDVDKNGEKLTEEQLEKKMYNKTYVRDVWVKAINRDMAIVKAVVKEDNKGWCEGNYLYVIGLEVEEL